MSRLVWSTNDIHPRDRRARWADKLCANCHVDDAQQRVAENVIDPIAGALQSQGNEPRRSAQMTHLRVKFWIETHLTEPLSAERIAAACGVSVRHLSRLFLRDGTSPMQHVWERRLDRCRRALSDPNMAHHMIGEIAFAAGFRDLSHFSHAYRARYGCSPREERARLSCSC